MHQAIQILKSAVNLFYLPFIPESPVWLLSTEKSCDEVRKSIAIIAPGRITANDVRSKIFCQKPNNVQVTVDNLHRRMTTLVGQPSAQQLADIQTSASKSDKFQSSKT